MSSKTWCQLIGMLQTPDTISVRRDVCVRLDASLLVCCRHWTPSKCALMSVWDSISTYWYVADNGHQCAMMSVWDLMPTYRYVADTGHHLTLNPNPNPKHHNVCVRLDASLLVCCRQRAPSKCAMMSVWDWILACWYVADSGHNLSSLWCLCETWCQLVGMLQTLDTI